MTMLGETVDAVIGIDTHRDSHEVEIADAAGRPVATMGIGNDCAGFTQLLATIAEVVPGPRVAVSIEGSRSCGIGLARALAAAGLLVIECEQPRRRQRRGKGKSDPIDAHLTVLAALWLDTARVPVPRDDGDREALRILLVARQEIRAPARPRPTDCVPCCWPVTMPTARLIARPWPKTACDTPSSGRWPSGMPLGQFVSCIEVHRAVSPMLHSIGAVLTVAARTNSGRRPAQGLRHDEPNYRLGNVSACFRR